MGCRALFCLVTSKRSKKKKWVLNVAYTTCLHVYQSYAIHFCCSYYDDAEKNENSYEQGCDITSAPFLSHFFKISKKCLEIKWLDRLDIFGCSIKNDECAPSTHPQKKNQEKKEGKFISSKSHLFARPRLASSENVWWPSLRQHSTRRREEKKTWRIPKFFSFLCVQYKLCIYDGL